MSVKSVEVISTGTRRPSRVTRINSSGGASVPATSLRSKRLTASACSSGEISSTAGRPISSCSEYPLSVVPATLTAVNLPARSSVQTMCPTFSKRSRYGSLGEPCLPLCFTFAGIGLDPGFLRVVYRFLGRAAGSFRQETVRRRRTSRPDPPKAGEHCGLSFRCVSRKRQSAPRLREGGSHRVAREKELR